MAWVEASLDAGAAAIAGTAAEAALFDGDPEGSGTELSGGSYARVALMFGAPEGGSAQDTATFAIPAGASWDHAAVYDSGGSLANSGSVPSESSGSGGSYDLTVVVPVTSE